MMSIDQQVIPFARIIAKLLNSIALVQKLHLGLGLFWLRLITTVLYGCRLEDKEV